MGATQRKRIDWQPGEMENAIAGFTGNIKKIPASEPKPMRPKKRRWEEQWSSQLEAKVYGVSKHED